MTEEIKREENAIYIRVNPKEINYFNQIIEAHDGLGVLTTLDAKTGDAVVRVTPDTKDDIIKVLKSLSREIIFLD